MTMACIVHHKHKDASNHKCAESFVVMVTVSHTDNSFVVMDTCFWRIIFLLKVE